MSKYQIASLTIFALSFNAANSAYAQQAGNTLEIPAQALANFSITDLGAFIGALLSLLFVIAGILVFLNLVIGGLQWIISGGDKQKTDSAQGRIVSAFIGITIVALSYAVIRFAGVFLGINILEPTLLLPYIP